MTTIRWINSSTAILTKACFGLFLLFFLTINSFSQNKYTVIPGSGVEGITIGSSIDNVIRILGEAEQVSTFAEEKKLWENYGYKTSNKLIFLLKFDNVYSFPTNNPLTVFKIFTTNNKVTFISLSCYHDQEVYSKVKVLDKISFKEDLASIERTLGKPEATNISEKEDICYFYFTKGIYFLSNREDGLSNFYIFAPLDSKTIKKIKKKICD